MSIIGNKNNSTVSRASFTLGNTLTYFARIFPLSTGKAGLAVIHIHGPAATYRNILSLWSVAPGWLVFYTGWSTTSVAYTSPAPTVTFGKWSSVGVTYDYGSTANRPTLYTNGVASTLSAPTAPAGTPRADGGTIAALGDALATYVFDGPLADWAVWNRQLTALEMALVHVLGPLAVPSGLQIYWPFPSAAASAVDYSGNARDGTISNALVGPDHDASARVLPLTTGGPIIPASARFDVKSVSYDPNTARLTFNVQEF